MAYFQEKYNEHHKQLYTAADLAHIVEDNVEYYETWARRLEADNRKARDEVRAEMREEYAEIQRLRDKLRFSPFSFASQKELDNYNDFQKRHEKCMQSKNNTRDFYVKPYFTGFSVGVYACCPVCGDEEDISDIEVW